MQIAVPTEQWPNERRVALIPDSVKKLARAGFSIHVQDGCGNESGYSNEDYTEAGATVSSDREAMLKSSDIILRVRKPDASEVNLLKSGAVHISYLDPYNEPELVDSMAQQGVSAISMEMIPRTTRAQKMDALSSQANLAGYRSVIDAAEQFGKAFPMMMTAAGRVNPAKVMILGVGVAGLQAIATAKRLGAVVSATDVRAATKEQVESLGGKFIMVEDDEAQNAETEGGYAKEMSEEYKRKQAQLISETVAKQDIVICTALIPGKKAPVLITEEMVSSMIPGSVVIDLAVEAGGNCPLSKMNEIILVHPKAHIEKIFSKIPKEGLVGVEKEPYADTMLCPNSRNAILRSCGAGIAAADELMLHNERILTFCVRVVTIVVVLLSRSLETRRKSWSKGWRKLIKNASKMC